MPFTDTTLATAQGLLAERLSDPLMVRWPAVELTRLLQDALRTWNAYTNGYRRPVTFSTIANQAFYDLPTVATAVRGYTLRVQDLITRLQDHLLEPPTPTVWTGTVQYVLDDLTAALNHRRDQFLLETGAVLTATTLTVGAPPPQGRIALPESFSTIRRVAWQGSAGTITPLYRGDEWGAQAYEPTWVQNPTRPPRAYSVTTVPPLQLQLLPPPLDVGTVHVLAVEKGAELVVADNTLIGIPDDWTWVIQFGALVDLLSQDGTALDAARAVYCEARWRQGIEAAAAAPVVLTGRVTDRTVRIGSVVDADTYRPLWQSVAGTPDTLLTAGQNLVAVVPPPDTPAGPPPSYSLTLDVVANMDVPVNAGDFLQILPDQLDPLLDYTQHLALFKEGPGVLEASMALFERFIRAAGVDLVIQQASQPARRPLIDQTQQGEHAVARTLPVAAGGA